MGETMTEYKNLSGESGVVKYEILSDGIRVQWVGGDIYYYSNASAGADHISEMKRLAQKGRGLATYISQNVRGNYEYKE